MITQQEQSNVPPAEWTIGQTFARCCFDITQIDPEIEEGQEPYTLYTFTSITMTPSEYADICEGRYTGEYNASFRRKEREHLLTEADKMKEKANDYITANIQKTKWQTYLKDLVEYKIAVRDTVNQETFPLSVIYPALPEHP